ncbi:hypothetical protein M2R28_16265 [Aeromonas hydrophila]|uniref:hypothetical protein n=1 Tax=Aeromonas hydrophila TaxID=644 RepID=UPI00208E8B0D|nr:hypothetical protein [Aeromonas hydrophila]MCO4201221.1 hypothetical protein [Aeromonas hydrophila]
MNFIESENMLEQYKDLPMSFFEWSNKWFDLHKECPDYLMLTKKEQKEYTKRIKGAGFDIELVMLYLATCCYPLVPSRKSIMRQIWFRFGGNPTATELGVFVNNMGSDLYQNINGLRQKICLVK